MAQGVFLQVLPFWIVCWWVGTWNPPFVGGEISGAGNAGVGNGKGMATLYIYICICIYIYIFFFKCLLIVFLCVVSECCFVELSILWFLQLVWLFC